MIGSGSDNDKGLVEHAEAVDGFQSNSKASSAIPMSHTYAACAE